MSTETTTDQSSRRLNAVIYLVLLIFFAYKMVFYAKYVARFPDEIVHISYIASLEQSNRLIPDFKSMTILNQTGTVRRGVNTYTFGKSINYLGHPSLYYQIMRLSGGVRVSGRTVTVDIWRLRIFTMSLAALALLIIFYLGYSRLGKSPLVHLLYGVICISVPMFAYDSAAVNNDTLSALGAAVFLLGIFRFIEKKRTFGTYLLISIGTFLSLLSKLTTGFIVLLSLFLIALMTIIRERDARFLISRGFLVTLPIYFAAGAYFLAVYRQTGTIQPTLLTLSPAQFYVSGFYTKPQYRMDMSSVTYLKYFAAHFLASWTNISSHVSLIKTSRYFSLSRGGLTALWFFPPILWVFLFFRKQDKKSVNTLFAVFIAVMTTVAYQTLRAYQEFKYVSGYLGGFQSRYYLCFVPVMAFAAALLAKGVLEKSPVRAGFAGNVRLRRYTAYAGKIAAGLFCLLFSGLLLYEDFIYFLLNFKDYLK